MNRHRLKPWLGAVLAVAAPAPLAAQEQPVGPPAPPEVRDFQLKPGADQRPAATVPLPPVELPRVDAVPAAATSVPPEPSARTSAGPPEAGARSIGSAAGRRARVSRQSRPVAAPAGSDPRPESPVSTPADAAAPIMIPPASANPPASPAPRQARESEGFPWLYAILAALAALAGLALFARRRPAVRERDEPADAPEAGTVEPPEPAHAAAAAAVPAVAAEARPRIALEFTPLMAGSTEDQAAVQFELAVRNGGDAVAGNVRIAIRMINAGPGQDDELAAFFREPIPEADHRPLTIPPGGRAQTRRTAVLPKEAVHAISFQGKSLFIPVVAFNVLYDWGDGRQGQTATSFVVGRETNPPAEKMAPFRLDLGPRIYRTVGQRRNELELVA